MIARVCLRRVLLGATLIGVPACGGAESSELGASQAVEPGVSAPHAATVVKEILHSLNVRGQEVEFVSIRTAEASEDQLVVSSRGRAEDVVGELFRLNGPLTLLEVFRAIAPVDLVPDDRLVASHVTEASLLGRADTSIREALLPEVVRASEAAPGETVLKVTLPPDADQTCRAALFTNDALNVWTRVAIATHTNVTDAGSTPGFICVGGESGNLPNPATSICPAAFTQPLRVGLCALSPDSGAASFQVAVGAPNGNMGFLTPDVLNVGENFITTFPATAVERRIGIALFPPNFEDSIYLMGSGVSEPP